MASGATGGPIWFITGCSTGLGRALAAAVLRQGHRVVVTARRKEQVADIAAISPECALTLDLDVTKEEQIATAVACTKAHFGGIDILVNNAGYGYQSSVEEGKDARIRALFDTNVFGAFAVAREILPVMRQQRRGHVFNVSSVGGLIGYPSSGYYTATKHAIEGWSDSLKIEVAPLGIQVTCIEPGPFRTDFAGRSIEQNVSDIDDYAATAAMHMHNSSAGSGAQPGDPARAAQAVIALALRPNAPRHLVLGRVGHDLVTEKLAGRLREIERLRAIALSADFPDN